MEKSVRWPGIALYAAALHSFIWSALCSFAPALLEEWLGWPPVSEPALRANLAAGAAVFGVGYALSGRQPARHWPVVVMGLLWKLGQAAWIVPSILQRRLNPAAWRAVWLGELIWAIPFIAILISVYSQALDRRRVSSPEIVRLALRARTQFGMSVDELSRLSPILLVFLRHAGCPFCREALADLAEQRREIEASGTRIVLVYMGSGEEGSRFFAKFGLEDAPRVSDPARALYRAFGLRRGGLAELLGPKVWWRGFQAAILHRHGAGRVVGDAYQMPGAFIVYQGEILRSYRHQSAADRPDYAAFADGRAYVHPELGA